MKNNFFSLPYHTFNTEYSTISEVMIHANNLSKLNTPNELIPFTETEITYAKFVDNVRLQSQQTKDYVLISETLMKVYDYLHIDMMIFKEVLSEYKTDSIKQTFEALKRLGLQNLLLDGLSKKVLKFVENL